MKNALLVNLGLLVVLGAASGASKIARLPFEVAIFGAGGFSDKAIVMIGMTQVVGAIMLLLPSVRPHGGAVLAATFALFAVLTFMVGEVALGLVPLVFAAMGGLVVATNKVPED